MRHALEQLGFPALTQASKRPPTVVVFEIEVRNRGRDCRDGGLIEECPSLIET
jgi:hypothetical protein